MTRLLSIALLAATLSAQSSSFVDRYDTRFDSTVRLNPGVCIVNPPSMVSTESWRGPSPLVISAPATSFDGNGALEAFYLQKPEKTYYWYSLQQEIAICDIAESNGRPCVRKTIRVRGINRSYTEITHTKKPWGYWPDYRLVTVRKGGN